MSNESIVPLTENEPFAVTVTFSLVEFLSLDAPMREVVLPLLTPEDLRSLELVSRRVRDVIRAKGLWEMPVKRFIESDPINRQIYNKCIAGRVDQAAAAVSEGVGDVDEIANSRDYRELFYQIQDSKRQLDVNIRRGYRKEHAVSWSSDSDYYYLDCLSTDLGDFVFIAHDYRVEVFEVAAKRNGSTLERASRYDIDLTGKFEEYAGLDTDPSFIHQIRCHGELLFIFHQSGAVSVWTWKDGSLVHNVTRHAFPKEILQKLDSHVLAGWVYCDTTLAAMECKQNQLMLAAKRPVDAPEPDIFGLKNEPVTVWKFDVTQPFLIALDYEIDCRQFGRVTAIDFDDHLAAFAFSHPILVGLLERTPVGLWDLETKTCVRWIYPHAVCIYKLFINARSNRLMIQPTSVHRLKMFSLQDGEELLSYDIDDVKALGGEMVLATAIARDWKSGQMFVGFTNGGVALFYMNDPKPINIFQRSIENIPVTDAMLNFNFLGSRAYLVFVQNLKQSDYQLGLFDFLELSP